MPYWNTLHIGSNMGVYTHIGADETPILAPYGFISHIGPLHVLTLVVPIWEKILHIGIQYGCFSYLV